MVISKMGYLHTPMAFWHFRPGIWHFFVASARTWNDLMDDAMSAKSLSTFYQQLRIHPFQEFFSDHFVNWPNLSLVDLAVVCIT